MWSFATTGMDHGGIMLSDVSRQRKTNSVQSHIYVESSKKVKVVKTEVRMAVVGDRVG